MVKTVSFKKSEQSIIDFIEGKDFSYYVKGLIKKDMNTSNIPEKKLQEEPRRSRRNTNFEIG